MTLPLLSHTCAAVLSTYMWMCAKGAILGVKRRICISINPSSRSFIVTFLAVLEEDTRRAWVVREKRVLQKSIGPLILGTPLPFLTPMHR